MPRTLSACAKQTFSTSHDFPTSSPGPSPRRFSKMVAFREKRISSRRAAILKIVEEKALGTRMHDFHWPVFMGKKCLPALETWQITGLVISITTTRKESFDSHDECRNRSANDNPLSTRNEKCVCHCSGWDELVVYCQVNRVLHACSEPFVSRAKFPPAKRSKKGYAEEKAIFSLK